MKLRIKYLNRTFTVTDASKGVFRTVPPTAMPVLLQIFKDSREEHGSYDHEAELAALKTLAKRPPGSAEIEVLDDTIIVQEIETGGNISY